MSKAFELLKEKLASFDEKIEKELKYIEEAEEIIKSSQDEILQRKQVIESLNAESRFCRDLLTAHEEEVQAAKQAAEMYLNELKEEDKAKAESFLKALGIEIEEIAEENETEAEDPPLGVSSG